MKRKIKLIVMLFVFACLSLTVGFACNDGSSTEPIKITGFDESSIVSEITVNAGESVSVQSPLVLDENNNVMDVHISVTDSNGGYVEVKANKFFALDGGGYTIKYLVQTYDNNVHIRTTNVKVNGNFYVGTDMQLVNFLGDTIEVSATHRLDTPSISFEVKDPDGDAVSLVDDVFEATKSGFYTLTITATEDGRDYKYETKIYVYEYARDYVYGAVEVFDENWSTVRTLSGYGFQNWTLTNTKETGVLGPKGTNDWFLIAKTESGWQGGLDFWLNPIFDKENYEGLLADGFTDIIVPIMIKGSSTDIYCFTTGHVQYDTSYMYQRYVQNVKEGEWTYVKIPIQDTVNDWQRSFLSCYEYYANQITQFIRINGFSGNCTMYLGSIYALKDKTLTADTEATKNVSFDVGHTIDDLGAYIGTNPDNIDVEYRILFRNEETIIEQQKDGESNIVATPYTFSGNGEYVISVVPARKDYSGGFNFTVTVSDDVSISYTDTSDVEYPRDSSSSRIINFADLGIILKDGEGNVITDVSYKVYYDGNLIDSADDDFTATKDGKYTVVAVGKYDQNKELVAYKDTIVSVFSEADFGIIDKQNVKTLNIANKINSIMEYSPAKNFTTYKLVRIIGPNEVELTNAPITAGDLDLTKLVSGYYKIYATADNGVDDVAYIDVWDFDEGHLFNMVSEDTLDYVLNYKKSSWSASNYQEYDDITVSEDDAFFASYFSERGNSIDTVVKVYPLHSKAYYEQFEGMNGVITFDFYYVADSSHISYRPIGVGSGRPDASPGASNKLTLSFELDDLLEYWSVYNSADYTSSFSYLVKELGWVWNEASNAHNEMTIYVGNFKFSYVGSAVTDTKLHLIDVNGLATYDVSTLISDEGKAVMTTNETYSYVLSCNSYNVELGSEPIVDVTKDANQRLFDLKVYNSLGFLIYKGKVDFYDSTKAPVWNTVDASYFTIYSDINAIRVNEYSVEKVAKGEQQVDAIKIAKLQLGNSNSYYVMNPIHSKEYYVLMVEDDGTYKFTYSVFFDAASGVAPLNQFLALGGTIATEAKLNKDAGWYDLSVSLADLVANWDNYIEVQGKNGSIAWGDRNRNGMFCTYNPKADVTIYVTGFQLSGN